MGRIPVISVFRGRVPGWSLDGSGSGDCYGSGDGSGDGDCYGSGDGDGYGDGDCYGNGSGFSSGYGSGSGSGSDVERCRPAATLITIEHLRAVDACIGAIRLFKRAFPRGGEFPRDIAKAESVGLDLEWACEKLGLIPPRTEDIPNAI